MLTCCWHVAGILSDHHMFLVLIQLGTNQLECDSCLHTAIDSLNVQFEHDEFELFHHCTIWRETLFYLHIELSIISCQTVYQIDVDIGYHVQHDLDTNLTWSQHDNVTQKVNQGFTTLVTPPILPVRTMMTPLLLLLLALQTLKTF